MRGRFIVVLGVLAVFLALAGSAAAQPVPGQYIVVLKPGTDAGAVAAQHARSANADVFHVYRAALRGYAARLSDQGLARVRADSRVLYVSFDHEVRAFAQQSPTGIRRIGASSDVQTQTLPGDGAGVGVAVIDTGIDLDHPDLQPVVNAKNCVNSRKSADDDNGHGSHVAGTIAARENTTGVVGVAPASTLYAVKVLNRNGSGSWSSVICGID